MSRSWFRRRKYATGGPVSAGSIVVLGGCDLTVPQPVDEDLADRVAKLTAEVRELHQAVDRLAVQPHLAEIAAGLTKAIRRR